jgi:outer membrane protein assembly factor BamD
MKNYLYIVLFAMLFSCNGYQKIVKSNDIELKYIMAKKFYEEDEYYKALPLLDELHTLFKGGRAMGKCIY